MHPAAPRRGGLSQLRALQAHGQEWGVDGALLQPVPSGGGDLQPYAVTHALYQLALGDMVRVAGVDGALHPGDVLCHRLCWLLADGGVLDGCGIVLRLAKSADGVHQQRHARMACVPLS